MAGTICKPPLRLLLFLFCLSLSFLLVSTARAKHHRHHIRSAVANVTVGMATRYKNGKVVFKKERSIINMSSLQVPPDLDFLATTPPPSSAVCLSPPPPPLSPPPPPPTPSPPPPAAPRNAQATQFLSLHNDIRARYNLPPFKWDRKVAKFARRSANLNRPNCDMKHSTGPYGENLFQGTGMNFQPADAVRMWADEHQHYDHETNTCAPDQLCGHFTQIVWKSSTRLGCARVYCDNGGVVVHCNYDPPGNWKGEKPF